MMTTRKEASSPAAHIGRVMVIKAMERLKSGAFRHPQFQCIRAEGDKSPFECVWKGDD